MNIITDAQVEQLTFEAYQLFQDKPSYLLEDGGVPMFSYERLAKVMVAGILMDCKSRGLTLKQSQDFLQSTGVRHLLDQHSDKLEALMQSVCSGFPIESYIGSHED